METAYEEVKQVSYMGTVIVAVILNRCDKGDKNQAMALRKREIYVIIM